MVKVSILNCSFNSTFCLSYGDSNAINQLGFEVEQIYKPNELRNVKILFLYGVGSYSQALKSLQCNGFIDELRLYLKSNRPFFGIDLGMLLLFHGIDCEDDTEGLAIIKGNVSNLSSTFVPVPQVGWNTLSVVKECLNITHNGMVYFMHCACVLPTESNLDWIASVTDYGEEQQFISSISEGNIFATQFHPELSGSFGLDMIKAFINKSAAMYRFSNNDSVNLLCDNSIVNNSSDGCSLDKSNEKSNSEARISLQSLSRLSQLVTSTKLIASIEASAGEIISNSEKKNFGDGVVLTNSKNSLAATALSDFCARCYRDGAHEIFIKNERDLQGNVTLVKNVSNQLHIPVTVTLPILTSTWHDAASIATPTTSAEDSSDALAKATVYFSAGAARVIINSDDAADAAEAFLSTGIMTGSSSIEKISKHYGTETVVVRIDTCRKYTTNPVMNCNNISSSIDDSINGIDSSSSDGGGSSIDSGVKIIAAPPLKEYYDDDEEAEDGDSEHPALALMRGMGRTIVHLSNNNRNTEAVNDKNILGAESKSESSYCWWPVKVANKNNKEVFVESTTTTSSHPSSTSSCWYRQLDAVMLAKICEIMGAGEILLNSTTCSCDGNNACSCEYDDWALVNAVQGAVNIPVTITMTASKGNCCMNDGGIDSSSSELTIRNTKRFAQVYSSSSVRPGLAISLTADHNTNDNYYCLEGKNGNLSTTIIAEIKKHLLDGAK